MRQCGTCQLCCKLLPVREGVDIQDGGGVRRPFFKFFDKAAGVRCEYQRHGKGCAIYKDRPQCCEVWSCRWLLHDDTDDLRRPDRSHYCIDPMPDFITIQPLEGETQNIQVVQIWIDPDFPEAHRDPDLRAYLARRGDEGVVGLVRYDSHHAMVIVPPAMSDDRQWHEVATNERAGREHSMADIVRALT